jgi:hypothetical protein
MYCLNAASRDDQDVLVLQGASCSMLVAAARITFARQTRDQQQLSHLSLLLLLLLLLLQELEQRGEQWQARWFEPAPDMQVRAMAAIILKQRQAQQLQQLLRRREGQRS